MKVRRLLYLLIVPFIASCAPSEEAFSGSTKSYDVSFPSTDDREIDELTAAEFVDIFLDTKNRNRYEVAYSYESSLTVISDPTQVGRPVIIKPTRGYQVGTIYSQENRKLVTNTASSVLPRKYYEIFEEDDKNVLYYSNYTNEEWTEFKKSKNVSYDKFYLSTIFEEVLQEDFYKLVKDYNPDEYSLKASGERKYVTLEDVNATDNSQSVSAKFNILLFFRDKQINEIQINADSQVVSKKSKLYTFSAKYSFKFTSFETIINRPEELVD